MPAIGWSLQASGSSRKASSTPIPRRGQWEAGPQIIAHKVAPAKTQQRHEQHVCFTAAYRIQSGRLVLELVGEKRCDLRSSGVESPNTLADLRRPVLLLEKNPCRSSARHQRVPSPAKESSKPLGFGRSRPGTEAAYLVHARRAAPAVRVRCPSA